jgi:hypothetical protein
VTEIGLFEAIYSARALRRLKPDSVPDDVIARILDAAIRAPTSPVQGECHQRVYGISPRRRASPPLCLPTRYARAL